MTRHGNALGVQEGPVNLAGVAKLLVHAAAEAAGEGVGAERDAAVRLIVHRLAQLCRVDDISYGYDKVTLADTYCILMNECKERAAEGRDLGALVLPQDRPAEGTDKRPGAPPGTRRGG